MKMRRLQLPGRQYGSTTQVMNALAWATQRRGRVEWKDDNGVAKAIHQYLLQHNVKIPQTRDGEDSVHTISYVMKRLSMEGYAEVKQKVPGQAFTSFRFKDDVDLSGHEPKFSEPKVKVPEVTQPDKIAVTTPAVSYDQAGSEGFLDMPLPPAPKPPRYKADVLEAGLDMWWEQSPDTYSDWADKMVERLRAVLGE